MQQPMTSPKTDWKVLTIQELLDLWRQDLLERDRSTGTVRKYTQAVAHFLAWYEREEQELLSLESMTPIALIGYRNELQHAQHKSTSTINLHVSALRAWCGWMAEQSYLASDPAAHVKLVGQEKASERSGLEKYAGQRAAAPGAGVPRECT